MLGGFVFLFLIEYGNVGRTYRKDMASSRIALIVRPLLFEKEMGT